jgi:hypothetical protein
MALGPMMRVTVPGAEHYPEIADKLREAATTCQFTGARLRRRPRDFKKNGAQRQSLSSARRTIELKKPVGALYDASRERTSF